MTVELTDDAYTGEELQEPQEPEQHPLVALLQAGNVADELSEETLTELGMKVVREYDIDVVSRADWLAKIDKAVDLAMQVAEEKSYPWRKAANVKYPLMTVAAIQFAARAYPAIVPPTNLVKPKMIGKHSDEKREKGDRVATHMSWQLSEEMPEWDEETDKLLHILPIVGWLLRKTWFDPALGRNRSRIVHPKKCVVNYNAMSIETVPRITEEIDLYPYQITEKRRAGTYRDIDLPLVEGEDKDAPHVFLEQHRLVDLDGDGYEEPWIVTVHKESSMVVRIEPRFDETSVVPNEKGEIARIEPIHHYTKYTFLPSPDGSFYDIGFGMLLGPINETINAAINQMLDAGHLQTVGGGFINASLRLRGGTLRFKPGAYKQVTVPAGTSMRDAVFNLDHAGPSAVLFNLLGLLLEAAQDISAVQDVLTGESQGANETATTTLARIEQGLKVFTAIYKRIYRSLKSEYSKMYDLNARYLDPQTYFTVLDAEQQIGPEDYDKGSFDVVPVADPASVSDMQKLMRAEFLLGFRGDPMVNQQHIRRRAFEAASIDDIDELFEVEQPPPPPELVEAMHRADMDVARLQMEQERHLIDMGEVNSKIILNLAKAEAAEVGPQLEFYKTQAKEITDRMKINEQSEQRRVRDMAGASSNGAGAPVS